MFLKIRPLLSVADVSISNNRFVFRSEMSFESHFRGCLGQVRLGGILLPFFTEEALVNSTASQKFVIESESDLNEFCTLCYEHECQNGGECKDPYNEFECTCPVGFEDALCSTNIDECANSQCQNGACVDGIANYTCSCDAGWTGWM